MHRNQIETNALKCESVGFLVREDKKSVSVALNMTPDEDYKPFGDVILIPKVSIISKKVLKVIKE